MRQDDPGIPNGLRAARERAGLSQRALAAQVGIPQSHISAIETGAVDAQISTIIEIARALGYDVRLIPRSSLPAVDAVVRQTARLGDLPGRLSELARRVDTRAAPFDTVTDRVRERVLQSVPLLGRVILEDQDYGELVHSLKRLEAVMATPPDAGATVNVAATLQRLIAIRNRAAHASSVRSAEQAPAYRLEDEEDE